MEVLCYPNIDCYHSPGHLMVSANVGSVNTLFLRDLGVETRGSANQGLILAQCSGVIPNGVQGTRCSAGDFRMLKDSILLHCFVLFWRNGLMDLNNMNRPATTICMSLWCEYTLEK